MVTLVRNGNIFTSAIDEMLASQGLQQKEGGNIDDLTAAVVIQHRKGS